MKSAIIIILAASILFASCGKKEENQPSTQQMQQTSTGGQQPITQTQQQTTQQKDTSGKSNDTKIQDDKNADNKKTNTDKTQGTKKDSINKLTTSTQDKVYNNTDKVVDFDFSNAFFKKCSKCHGRDGHGKPDGAPNLTADSTRAKSDQQLFKILSNGIKNPDPDGDDMPAWKGKLTDDEINAAIKYIKSLP